MDGNAAIRDTLNGATDLIWGEPDLSVLNGFQKQPPILPLEPFGPWADWLERAAENASAPVDYVAAGLLAASSTLIGNSRWVSPWAGWAEPPNLWAACVGSPSAGKTPALNTVLGIIDKFEGEDALGFDETYRQYEADRTEARLKHESWQKEVETAVNNNVPPPLPPKGIDIEEPCCPRIKVNDTTVEQLAKRLASQPKGLMLVRDELSGWLGGLDKYSAGDRGFWIEGYTGGGYTVDRVKYGNKPIRIPRLSISILGGIQPDRLQSLLLRGDDDGLPARFLMFWPNPTPLKRPLNIGLPIKNEIALRHLKQLQMSVDENGIEVPSYRGLTEEAADRLHEWREEVARKVQFSSGRLTSHLGKIPGLTARLSLNLAFLHWALQGGEEPIEIEKRFVELAVMLMGQYFIPMAERAYGIATLPEEERGAIVLARHLKGQRFGKFNAPELRRNESLPGLRDAKSFENALTVLEEANILKAVPSRSGETAGRQRKDYIVNPAFIGDSDE